jgi:hypothetical protein
MVSSIKKAANLAAANRAEWQRWTTPSGMRLSEEKMQLNAACTSGTSPTQPDFVCENHGSLFLLIPRSAPAKNWVEENLSPDRLTFCDAVVIEPRYLWTILLAIQDAEMAVERG